MITIMDMLQVLYLVKWVGWDEETWEPEGNLEGSEILIADYQQRQSGESRSGAEKQNNSEDGDAFEEMPTETELPSKKLVHLSDPVDLCTSVGGLQTVTKDTDASQGGRDSIRSDFHTNQQNQTNGPEFSNGDMNMN